MAESTPNALRVGIDLGTTNSLIAHVDETGQARVLPNSDNEESTPSVVALPKGVDSASYRTVQIGREAENNAKRNPRNTVRSIKRFVGLSFNDPKVQVARERVGYRVEEDPTGGHGVVVRLGESLPAPEEISAHVLRRLKEDAEARLGAPVTHAVITVPAYFHEHQRKATRQAGALAGLKVLAVFDEPTAAALSEGAGTKEEQSRVLVFDFGGGTLDISLVQRAGGDMMILGYTGDNFLGGDEIDQRILDHVVDWIRERGGQVGPDDHNLLQRLRESARAAKHNLSSGTAEVYVDIPSVRTRDGGWFQEKCEEEDDELVLTQGDFEKIMKPIEARIHSILSEFLTRQGMQPENLTEVLMVGGSSAVDRVRILLQSIFETDGVRRVRLAYNPMQAVAKGAALYAQGLDALVCEACETRNPLEAAECQNPDCRAQLLNARSDMDANVAGVKEISAAIPRSLGVAYRKGSDTDAYQAILGEGTMYPVTSSERFQVPREDRMQILIYEGDQPKASHNTLISMLTIDQIPPDVKAGDPVEVCFTYDRDRTLLISLNYPTSSSGASPTWRLEPPDAAGRKDDPVRQVAEFIPHARGFMQEYDSFLDAGARKTLNDHIRHAQDLTLGEDREGAKQVMQALHSTMLTGCGVASALWLAEHTIAQEDRQLGPAIRRAAEQLRDEVARGDPQVEVTHMGLMDLVHKAFQEFKQQHGGEMLDDEALIVRGTGGA